MFEPDLEWFYTPLPRRILRLRHIAYNLWWSWYPEAQWLYRQIDPDLWETVYHNPVRFLRRVRQRRLEQAAGNPSYVQQYDQVIAAFDAYMQSSATSEQPAATALAGQTIAYFSAEFGLHESLPIYSGGLGLLAGDLLKEASDSHIPLVAVGFLYPQGYFLQRIDEQGQQHAEYPRLHGVDVPIIPARTAAGHEVIVDVELAGRITYAKVYRIQVGRVPLFLMDIDIHPNTTQNRELLAKLYTDDEQGRIAQEIMLGIGGVRLLRQLGIQPTIWHLNESHAAFLVLEVMRERVSRGMPFAQAMQTVRQHTVFTTHSPSDSERNIFSTDSIKQFFWRYWQQLGINYDTFLNLARTDRPHGPGFSMTALALQCSRRSNAVSQLHGEVVRDIWQRLMAQAYQSSTDRAILSITNGVHTASWLAPELAQLYDAYLGVDWHAQLTDPAHWQRIYDIPNDVLWRLRRLLKHQLLLFVRNRIQQRAQRLGQDPLVWPVLEEDALTIGFARRFAGYKRANLLFHDIDRLKHLLNAPGRPVQVIFAGKAHPEDTAGQQVIREVYQRSLEPGLAGRIVLLEEYDLMLGRELVKGVDLWLNTPRRRHEASGTSGQKASLNGVPTISTLDGWWPEAYNGANGWQIGDEHEYTSNEEQDQHDAQSLYDTLESQVIPLFFDQRDSADVPNEWVQVCKEAIVTVTPQYSTRRMLSEYVQRLYTE
ncbi:MAG: glycosyltransferase family 1 protein [Chloroflexaceae bacterium]|nr:glycosyltransferase family 1 protein [Chloroflexaceae bacterium]